MISHPEYFIGVLEKEEHVGAIEKVFVYQLPLKTLPQARNKSGTKFMNIRFAENFVLVLRALAPSFTSWLFFSFLLLNGLYALSRAFVGVLLTHECLIQ